MFALQITGPVETAGRFLTYSQNYTGFVSTEAPYALRFGSRSSAYRFRKSAASRCTDGVVLKVVEVRS